MRGKRALVLSLHSLLIWQCSLLGSSVENTAALQRESIHSFIGGIGYESRLVAILSSR